MKQYRIAKGSRVVIITEDGGTFSARLYVNHGETATLQRWKGTTQAGAERWALRRLNA